MNPETTDFNNLKEMQILSIKGSMTRDNEIRDYEREIEKRFFEGKNVCDVVKVSEDITVVQLTNTFSTRNEEGKEYIYHSVLRNKKVGEQAAYNFMHALLYGIAELGGDTQAGKYMIQLANLDK